MAPPKDQPAHASVKQGTEFDDQDFSKFLPNAPSVETIAGVKVALYEPSGSPAERERATQAVIEFIGDRSRENAIALVTTFVQRPNLTLVNPPIENWGTGALLNWASAVMKWLKVDGQDFQTSSTQKENQPGG